MLSFAFGSHCNFHSDAKNNFFPKRLYSQKQKINPVYVRIFLTQILRALLSNKMESCNFE